MMACSYLSAGGLKREPTSTACWSPPAVAGCHAADTRSAPMTLHASSMTLPTRPVNLQIGSMGLHQAMGLPRAPMILSQELTSPSSQMGLSSGAVVIPNQRMGLTSGSVGQLGQASIPVGPLVLPSPFVRPLPLDLHKTLSQTVPSASEPALDLSTSASPVTSSLKPQLPTPDKDAE